MTVEPLRVGDRVQVDLYEKILSVHLTDETETFLSAVAWDHRCYL